MCRGRRRCDEARIDAMKIISIPGDSEYGGVDGKPYCMQGMLLGGACSSKHTSPEVAVRG